MDQSRSSAGVTAVEEPVGEARPPGVAEHSATTGLAVALSSDKGEAGSSWSRKKGTTSAAATKSVGEVRPPGIAKFLVVAKSEPPRVFQWWIGLLGPEHMARPVPTSHQP